MYNISTVKTAFLDIIKWRKFDDPDIPQLDSGLTDAAVTTGIYYNDMSTMLYPENIEKILKHYDSFNYETWDTAIVYVAGKRVSYEGHAYISKIGNTGKIPVSNKTEWKTLISQELLNRTNDNTIKVIEQVLLDKKLNGLRPLMEDLRIFEGAGRIGDVIIKESRFVGISLALKKFNALRATILQMGLQFTQINTDLDIYVYHSSQDSAIKTFKVSTTEINTFNWNAISDCVFDYVKYTSGYDNGMFFIGYYEDDVTGQAINKQIDFTKEPTGCKNCLNGIHNLYAYNMYNKWVTIKPFSAIPNGIKMFDLDDVSYYDDSNFGMNFHITVECDITDLLIDNKNRFMDVIRKQMGVDLLKAIAYSTRNNIFEDRLVKNAITELKGFDGYSGAEADLKQAYKAIDLEMTIDSPCLGKKKRGIKTGAI